MRSTQWQRFLVTRRAPIICGVVYVGLEFIGLMMWPDWRGFVWAVFVLWLYYKTAMYSMSLFSDRDEI